MRSHSVQSHGGRYASLEATRELAANRRRDLDRQKAQERASAELVAAQKEADRSLLLKLVRVQPFSLVAACAMKM